MGTRHALGGVDAPEDVAAANDDGYFPPFLDHALDLDRVTRQHLLIDAVRLLAQQGLAAELEQNASIPELASSVAQRAHGYASVKPQPFLTQPRPWGAYHDAR